MKVPKMVETRKHPCSKISLLLLFLFDWCFCAWLPPSLCLRNPRASLGDCEDRSHSRPLRRKWSEASPRPLRGALPLRGPHPSLHLAGDDGMQHVQPHKLKDVQGGVTHVVIVACHHPLHVCFLVSTNSVSHCTCSSVFYIPEGSQWVQKYSQSTVQDETKKSIPRGTLQTLRGSQF